MDLVIEQGAVQNIGHRLDRPLGFEEYDGGGRWVIPGLWDAHVHLAQWTPRGERLDLSGSESRRNVPNTLAPAASCGSMNFSSNSPISASRRPGCRR